MGGPSLPCRAIRLPVLSAIVLVGTVVASPKQSLAGLAVSSIDSQLSSLVSEDLGAMDSEGPEPLVISWDLDSDGTGCSCLPNEFGLSSGVSHSLQSPDCRLFVVQQVRRFNGVVDDAIPDSASPEDPLEPPRCS